MRTRTPKQLANDARMREAARKKEQPLSAPYKIKGEQQPADLYGTGLYETNPGMYRVVVEKPPGDFHGHDPVKMRRQQGYVIPEGFDADDVLVPMEIPKEVFEARQKAHMQQAIDMSRPKGKVKDGSGHITVTELGESTIEEELRLAEQELNAKLQDGANAPS